MRKKSHVAALAVIILFIFCPAFCPVSAGDYWDQQALFPENDYLNPYLNPNYIGKNNDPFSPNYLQDKYLNTSGSLAKNPFQLPKMPDINKGSYMSGLIPYDDYLRPQPITQPTFYDPSYNNLSSIDGPFSAFSEYLYPNGINPFKTNNNPFAIPKMPVVKDITRRSAY